MAWLSPGTIIYKLCEFGQTPQTALSFSFLTCQMIILNVFYQFGCHEAPNQKINQKIFWSIKRFHYVSDPASGTGDRAMNKTGTVLPSLSLQSLKQEYFFKMMGLFNVFSQ